MYRTPSRHYLRLHFERSRFFRRLEDTLLLLAEKIVSLGMMEGEEFNSLFDKIIRETSPVPLTRKTVKNQRTEMIRLFGLVKYVDEVAVAGSRLALLARTQDIPRFFKSFCKRFQFPGGFLKPQKVSEMVRARVRFKPAKYILRLFMVALSKRGEFGINAAETAHFIFNDKRVTVKGESPTKILDRIIEARKKRVRLNTRSDAIRYARDFLNYMVEANLLNEFKGMYALNQGEARAIRSIVADKDFFDGYPGVIKPDGSWDVEEYKKIDTEWMEWFADAVEDRSLETPTTALVKDDVNFPDQWKKIKEILKQRVPKIRRTSLKELGDEGEKIAFEYERALVAKARPDLVRLVRIVSKTTPLGYDIISVWPRRGRRKKYIEVKTTKKNRESEIAIPFTLSVNEWATAQQHGDDYFIYRVIITKEGITVFAIQNPLERSKEGKIIIEPTAYKVVYSNRSGKLLKI